MGRKEGFVARKKEIEGTLSEWCLFFTLTVRPQKHSFIWPETKISL